MLTLETTDDHGLFTWVSPLFSLSSVEKPQFNEDLR